MHCNGPANAELVLNHYYGYSLSIVLPYLLPPIPLLTSLALRFLFHKMRGLRAVTSKGLSTEALLGYGLFLLKEIP